MLRQLRLRLLARATLQAHPVYTPFRTQSTAPTAQSTATTPGATPEKTEPSRWQRLKRERRLAPTPANRTAYAFDRTTPATLPEALHHMRQAAWAKFDESVELIFRLNIDPRLADQNVRGALELPHGTGRLTRVAVFADPDAAPAARAAGADLVGADDLVEAIKADGGASVKGFAACVAMPHLVPIAAASLGRILGPKGIMPSPKNGTVTSDVAAAVRRIKKGQVSYRTDRAGNVHLIVGKLSFEDEKLMDNVLAATRAIVAARPPTVKRRYLKKAVVCSSMGPSVNLNLEGLVRQASQQP